MSEYNEIILRLAEINGRACRIQSALNAYGQPPDEDATPESTKDKWWCPHCAMWVPGIEVTYEEVHEVCSYDVMPERPKPAQPVRRLKPQCVEEHGHVFEWKNTPGTDSTHKAYVGPVGSPEVKDCYEPQADAPSGVLGTVLRGLELLLSGSKSGIHTVGEIERGLEEWIEVLREAEGEKP